MSKRYFNEIKKIKALTNAETLVLIQRYKAGEEGVRNTIVMGYQQLVIHYAKTYFTSLKNHSIIELDDLIAAGNIGLIKSTENYNPEHKTQFSYYAGINIKGQIMTFILSNMNTISSPQNKMKSDHRINILIEELSQKLNREVNEDDIINTGQFTKDEVNHYFNKSMIVEMPEYFDAEDVEDIEYNNMIEQYNHVIKYLKYLKPKERIVIKHYYGINGYEKLNIPQIGQKLGVTKQRVNQIKIVALNKIKEKLGISE